MRWEYFGTGLALIGIGITLMVALPPPWWPKMPPPLVHIGVIVGAVLTFVGGVLAIYGAWPILPSPKIAILGMAFSVVSLVGFAIWFWALPNFIPAETEEPKPLKRMIAWGQHQLNVQQSPDNKWMLTGMYVRINNVSDETLTLYLQSCTVKIDDTQVSGADKPGPPLIVSQTQGADFRLSFNEGPGAKVITVDDAKVITVDIEYDYDTIPTTGLRRSYKQFTYPINWANGHNSAPLLEPKTTSEWEK